MYAGIKNNKGGYEGMVEAAKAVLRNFDQAQQRAIVIQALERAFPRPILTMASSFSFFLFLMITEHAWHHTIDRKKT